MWKAGLVGGLGLWKAEIGGWVRGVEGWDSGLGRDVESVIVGCVW